LRPPFGLSDPRPTQHPHPHRVQIHGDQGEEKRNAEEILADTRGYTSNEWTNFIYVIYETKRIKPEGQWRQLLRDSGVDQNTEVIVISGEAPRRPAKPKFAKAVRVQ